MKIRRFLPLAVAALAACAGNQIGSPGDYDPVPLNRVYPYPAPEELARQKTEVVLASHYTTELPRKTVGHAMTVVQQELLRVLREAGARVDDRSLDDLGRVRSELTRRYQSRGSKRDEAGSVLVTRIARYEHRAHYEPPSGLFKSEEELAAEPGTCTHEGEVGVDVKHLVIPTDEVARATFTLASSADFSQQDFDESCPISDERRQALLEEAIQKGLHCLDVPVKNEFAPRGYVEEHRQSSAGDVHIYRTSMGRRNGAREGLELSIFRTQYMTTANGQKARESRRIGKAVISDQIGEDFSWVLIDVGSVEQQVLAGDMVRAVYEGKLTTDLGFGGCSSMLTAEKPPR